MEKGFVIARPLARWGNRLQYCTRRRLSSFPLRDPVFMGEKCDQCSNWQCPTTTRPLEQPSSSVEWINEHI